MKTSTSAYTAPIAPRKGRTLVVISVALFFVAALGRYFTRLIASNPGCSYEMVIETMTQAEYDALDNWTIIESFGLLLKDEIIVKYYKVYDCSWLDSFDATTGEYLVGHVFALAALLCAATVYVSFKSLLSHR